MATKTVPNNNYVVDGVGKKHQLFNLKQDSSVVDFNKDEVSDESLLTSLDGGGSIKFNTLHKNDLKRGQLIDEISDLRDVLRRSQIGPLSREIINITEDFIVDPNHVNGNGIAHSKSPLVTSPSTLSNILQNQKSTSKDELFEALEKDINLQSGQEEVVTINKNKLMNLMKEYKRTKDDLKDHSNLVQEMDNHLTQVKDDLELKKKKIQLLKSDTSNNNNINGNGKNITSPSSANVTPVESKLNTSNNSNHLSQYTMSPMELSGSRMRLNQSNPQQSPLPLQQIQTHLSSSPQQHPPLIKDNQLNTSLNNLIQSTSSGMVITEDINQKIVEVLTTAKYRIERVQFKNRVLLTSTLHGLSSEIHTLLEKRITKKQVNAELRQNLQIVNDCDSIRATISNFMNELSQHLMAVDVHIEDAIKKKGFKSKEKSKRVQDLERTKRQIESAMSFLKIEKRSVRELRDRFVAVCNEVTKLYEICNSIERDLSKWDIELERIYQKIREGHFSDYFKLHPVFQACQGRIKDHSIIKHDLVRELARREAARIASEIYISGITQILDCGTDLITDERMVDLARVRGLEHQVHMLYHALHDQQIDRSYHSLTGQHLNYSIQTSLNNNSQISSNQNSLKNNSLNSNNNSITSLPTSPVNQPASPAQSLKNNSGSPITNSNRPASPSLSQVAHSSSPNIVSIHSNNRPASPSISQVTHNSSPNVTSLHTATQPIPIINNNNRPSSPSLSQVTHNSSPTLTNINNSSGNVPPISGFNSSPITIIQNNTRPVSTSFSQPNNHNGNFNNGSSASPNLGKPNLLNSGQIGHPRSNSIAITNPGSSPTASSYVQPGNVQQHNFKAAHSPPVSSNPNPNSQIIIGSHVKNIVNTINGNNSSNNNNNNSGFRQSIQRQPSGGSMMNRSSSNNNFNNLNPDSPPGSIVMEILIKNYDTLFPTNIKIYSSPILIKTSGYLESLIDLSADVLVQSAKVASGVVENKAYTDSLKVASGSIMGAEHVDVYMASELLKHFFKSVDPFLSKTLLQDWLLAEKMEDQDHRIQCTKQLISKLSDENRFIIHALVKMLNSVINKSIQTNPKLNPTRDLAKAFSSLILRTTPAPTTSVN